MCHYCCLFLCCRDEDGEPCEFLKPKLTFNPHFQKLYQVNAIFSVLLTDIIFVKNIL